jgi:hypothetical protein
MPKYFLNQLHEDRRIIDDEGAEFPDFKALQEELAASAREIVADGLRSGRGPGNSSFEVTDAAGAVVLVFPFRKAIPGFP